MKNMNLSAPLPFVGQKRMFAKEFIKVLEQFPEDTVFVDLFGGSGLLSHIAKRSKPDATVVYNDFDRQINCLPILGSWWVIRYPNINQLKGNLENAFLNVSRKKN